MTRAEELDRLLDNFQRLVRRRDWRCAMRSYPHMCRDDHPEIGHATDEERCPQCNDVFFRPEDTKPVWAGAKALKDMESRALAAEAEVANLRRHFEHRARGIDPLAEHLRAEADQLRADLAALVPLARIGSTALGGNECAGAYGVAITDAELATARAVLDRLKEGA